jgi:hypothetical protein
MIGFVQETSPRWSDEEFTSDKFRCFLGEKVDQRITESAEEIERGRREKLGFLD